MLPSDRLIFKKWCKYFMTVFHCYRQTNHNLKMQSSRLVPVLLQVNKVTSIFSIKVQGPKCCFHQSQLEKDSPLRIPGLNSSCV